jgi:hypothetical protein
MRSGVSWKERVKGGNRRLYEIGRSWLKEKRRKWRVGHGLLMWTDEIKSLHGCKIYNKMDLPPPYDRSPFLVEVG